jgi:hypothetical protein
MSSEALVSAVLLGFSTISTVAWADPIIYESFSNYPEDALIRLPRPGRQGGLRHAVRR